MSYESPDEKIERLEKQLGRIVEALRSANKILEAQRDGIIAAHNIVAATETANLLLFRVLFDLPSVPPAVRSEFGKLLSDTQKTFEEQKMTLQNLIKFLTQTVMPDDLFGPGSKWPPENPPPQS